MIARPPWREYCRLCRKPDVMRSLEDYDRAVHLDVPELSDFDLSREFWIVRDRLYRSSRPDPWFKERMQRLSAELQHRRRAS